MRSGRVGELDASLLLGKSVFVFNGWVFEFDMGRVFCLGEIEGRDILDETGQFNFLLSIFK